MSEELTKCEKIVVKNRLGLIDETLPAKFVSLREEIIELSTKKELLHLRGHRSRTGMRMPWVFSSLLYLYAKNVRSNGEFRRIFNGLKKDFPEEFKQQKVYRPHKITLKLYKEIKRANKKWR